MKKIYSFVFAAVALFSAASCQDELVNNETPTVQGGKFTITAIADTQTKTALADEGLNSVWTPGDAIAVIDYTGQGAEFTTAITENATSAKFTCEDFNVGGLTDISALPIVALYPYQAGLTCSIQSQLNPTGDNTIKGINFPNEQTAVAGSFDKTAAFTWAMATGATKDNLVFNNLYSLLKVKVTEEDITEIKVTATSGSLAGNVTLPITQSGATLTVVDGEGESEVTLTCEDGFDTDKYYYICVLPGTYEGFSIALNGYTVKTKASAATFAAATVYDLGEVARTKSAVSIVGALINGSESWDPTKNKMYLVDGYYLLKNVSIDGQFHFVDGDTWTNEYFFEANSGNQTVSAGNAYKVWKGGNTNSTITDGIYDVYFSVSKNFGIIVTAGTAINDCDIDFVTDNYGIIGTFKDNSWTSNIKFKVSGKYLAVKNLQFVDDGDANGPRFKIRQYDNWNTGVVGTSSTAASSVGSEIKLDGTNDIRVTVSFDKSYDIYTDLTTVIVEESETL